MPVNRTEVARGSWTTLCRLSWWTLRSIRSAVCVQCSRYASYIDQHSGRRLRDVACVLCVCSWWLHSESERYKTCYKRRKEDNRRLLALWLHCNGLPASWSWRRLDLLQNATLHSLQEDCRKKHLHVTRYGRAVTVSWRVSLAPNALCLMRLI